MNITGWCLAVFLVHTHPNHSRAAEAVRLRLCDVVHLARYRQHAVSQQRPFPGPWYDFSFEVNARRFGSGAGCLQHRDKGLVLSSARSEGKSRGEGQTMTCEDALVVDGDADASIE